MTRIRKRIQLKAAIIGLTLCLTAISLLTGCNKDSAKMEAGDAHKSLGVFYEIFVRSYQDSNGDGIGDLTGVVERLDYLQELGIEGIWLTPINPSPSYHGYDVTDYYDINPQFGTLADFHNLMEEAHKHGIKVIMDLVVNHTSTKNPWFIQSAEAENNAYRNWYTWEEKGSSVSMEQASATGGKAWHARNGSYYEATFWEGMPDLNFDNADVRKEIIKIGSFWLKQGIDGFRIDAAKHIYEDFQASKGDPEVARKNQAWWQEFRKGLNETNPQAYLVSEVWDSSGLVAPYLNHAFNSSFNFDIADLIKSAVSSERSADIAGKLKVVYGLFNKESNGAFVDAPFFDNHDKDRIMSLAGGNKDHAVMAAAILLTLPGNPFIYYGDEIGMKGSGPDEAKREPMLWFAAGKGAGQTTWEPLSSNSDNTNAPSVEAELADPNSIYSHYKQLILLRKKETALRDGEIDEFPVQNAHVISFIRRSAHEEIMVFHNVSKVEERLDLSTILMSKGKAIIFATQTGAKLEAGKLTLPAYSTVMLK